MLLGLIAAREAMSDAGIDPALMRVGTDFGHFGRRHGPEEKHFAQIREGKIPLYAEHDCGASTEHIANRLGIRHHHYGQQWPVPPLGQCHHAGRLAATPPFAGCVVVEVGPLCRFTINGFSSLMILDKERCRPFDAPRVQGLIFGEGAGYLVLQRDDTPAAHTYCQLKGYATPTMPITRRPPLSRARVPVWQMSRALMKAEMKPTTLTTSMCMVPAPSTTTKARAMRSATSSATRCHGSAPPRSIRDTRWGYLVNRGRILRTVVD